LLCGEIPDTGSLRGDALALLRRMSSRVTEIGPETVYGLLGDYLSDADLFASSSNQLLVISAEVMQIILKRAADRGEARSGVENRIATLPTALFRNELFLARTPPSEGTLVEIVDDVFLPLVRPS
jgi:hypothetical protein